MTARTRKYFTMTIIFIFIFLTAVGMGNYRSKQLAIDLVSDRVFRVVVNLTAEIDPEQLGQVIEEKDETDAYYLLLLNEMNDILKKNDLRGLYIVAKDKEAGKWFYVVDGRGPEDPHFFSLGQEDWNIDVAAERAIRRLDAKSSFSSGGSGARVSSFTGVFDAKGEAVAAVGADFDATEINKFLYVTKYGQVAVTVAGLCLLGVILLIYRKREGV